MKRGTKIGWLLIAVSIVLSIWVIVGQSSKATEDSDGVEQLYDIPDEENEDTLDADTPAVDVVTTDAAVADAMSDDTQTDTSDSTTSDTSSDTDALITQDDGLVLSSDGTRIVSYNGNGDSVTIPATVTSGATAALFSSSNLKHIYVLPGNSVYGSFGDCLYDASFSTLIKVPNGLTDITLNQSVSTIDTNAFDGSSISSVSVPDSVTRFLSQGSWSPTSIYCSEGSAADKYAQANHINAIYPTSNEGDDDDPTNNGGNANTNGGTTTNGGNSTNTTPAAPAQPAQNSTQTNNVTVTQTPQPAANTATTNTAGNSTTGGSSGRTGGHTQDATPKTADGDIDPRLILCFATLAAGIGILLYSRSRKKVIIAAESEHGLDD